MTLVGILLLSLGLYLLIGLVVGLAFVIYGVRVIDPVADAAPHRVRMLFLPGCVAIWPIVLHNWRAQVKRGIENES